MNWHDAYDRQLELWKWVKDGSGTEWLYTSYSINSEDISDEGTRGLLERMYKAELPKLWTADTFFVSADMCDLVDYAVETFEPEAIVEQDFLTHTGFLIFETPFEIDDRYGRPVSLAGFSWIPLVAIPDDRLGEGMVFSDEMSAEEAKEHTRGVALTLYGVTKRFGADGDVPWHVKPDVPVIVPFHLTPWWFDMEFSGNEIDLNNKPTAALHWWRVCQVTLRFMQQSITDTTTHLAPRPSRRRAQRMSFDRPDNNVMVVRLRRPPQHSGEKMGDRASPRAHVRSGHWRKQWYPTMNDHRQIWIHPTIVGEGEILRHGRRVFNWSR